MYVIVVGGGNVGTYLSRRLIDDDHEVLLLEKDPKQTQRLQALFGEASVIGDGCEAEVQRQTGFERADVVAAVTGEDEDNLIVCQMAAMTWGVERTVARVNDPRHVPLFTELGVSSVVSATNILYNLIEQEISLGTVVPLAALRRGNIEVVEATLTSRSPSAGHKVRDLSLPPKSNIVWVLRGEEGYLADGETVLGPGDLVVALVPTEHASALREIL
ncbi:MAG TPA: NAD-binding protein [Fimbriimonadales bacterium]|jgi:trk system potassium uptake protein TrkA|nr:NAD-binding protein [Fimbriimonadales bacterium]